MGKRRDGREEAGQGMAEFIIIVLCVALIALVAIRLFGRSVRCGFNDAAGRIESGASAGEECEVAKTGADTGPPDDDQPSAGPPPPPPGPALPDVSPGPSPSAATPPPGPCGPFPSVSCCVNERAQAEGRCRAQIGASSAAAMRACLEAAEAQFQDCVFPGR